MIKTDIEVVEVSPRDGLQNERRTLSVDTRLNLIDRCVATGARRIEAVSFVDPRRVAQMAHAEAVVAGLRSRAGVTYIGLVHNLRGLTRALATSIDEIGAVCVSTDVFASRNQGQTSDESVEISAQIIREARRNGRSAQATIAASFGCPYSGFVSPSRIEAIALRLADAAPREVVIADTIGVAVPNAVTELVERIAAVIRPLPVRAHLHDTRGTGIANVWAAVQAGASIVDAALGGTGGGPFANGAAGNVATEDVAYLLHQSRIRTNINEAALPSAVTWLGEQLGKSLPGKAAMATPFPPTQPISENDAHA